MLALAELQAGTEMPAPVFWTHCGLWPAVADVMPKIFGNNKTPAAIIIPQKIIVPAISFPRLPIFYIMTLASRYGYSELSTRLLRRRFSSIAFLNAERPDSASAGLFPG